MASQDFKFLKIINKVDSKTVQNLISFTKQLAAFEKMGSQSNNPFLINPFPPIIAANIPGIIVCLAQSLEEMSGKNLSLASLEAFVAINQDALVKILCLKGSLCQLFCLSFIRYFQQYGKTKELFVQIKKAQLFPFIILFSTIIQKRKVKKVIKPTKSQQKQINHQIHTLFYALGLATLARYLLESEEQFQEPNNVERALLAGSILVQQCQSQTELQAIRQYLAVSSYLLIFNGTAMRPQNLLSFSLNNDQRLYLGKENHIQLNSAIVLRFMRSLNIFTKKYHKFCDNLIKITKDLLTLSINNTILMSFFEILVELIRDNAHPFLKRQLFQTLIQNHIKRNIQIIDQFFIYLLGSGIDLLDEETQRYLLTLAELGDNKRKQRFAIIYYDQYEKSFNKVQEPIINIIFDVYLQQDLKILKIQLMVSKEALIISKSSISKLHSLIRQKNENRHINLLSIILERRKDNFQVGKKASPYPFIQEEWLNNAGNNPEIYKTYTKIITQMLCGKSLEVYPSMINLNKCIVRVSFGQHSKIEGKYFIRSVEFYELILKMAQKYSVFQETTFRYMILLQALLGEKFPLNSYQYFSQNVSKIVHPESTFLTYLEYLVTLLKNKSSVLLYLQAMLQFQMNLNDLFFEKKLYDISFLARLIQEQFFRLSTYSFESLTVIYELGLIVEDKAFQQDFLKILKGWSSVMSRSQCKNVTYFFAFREIKKIYPFMKERQMRNPSNRIKMIWDVIINLIDQKGISAYYLSMSPNKLIVSWKGEENAKKDIRIAGSFLRNQSMELFWSFRIKTSLKTYLIQVKNYNVVLQMEQIKQVNREFVQFKEILKETKVIELKKRPQTIHFTIRLENQSKKTVCHLSIMDTSFPDYHFEGNIESITLQCNDNAILKDIFISDALQPAQLSKIESHLHYLNQWQIKVSSLKKYNLQDFCDKFDFSHAYCSVGQMLKSFSHMTVSFAFDIFIRLSTRLIKHIHKNKRKDLLQLMLQVFKAIQTKYSSLRGRNKALTPTLQIENVKEYAKQLYYLFTTAFLPLTFWDKFSQQSKQDLHRYLAKLCLVEQFREIQNNELTLFHQALQICYQEPEFFEICVIIVNSHEFNEILTMKFNKFILLAKQSSIHTQYFNKFLQKNIKYLNIQNQKFVDSRLRCKFLIIDEQRIRQIFTICKIEFKIDILHYLSQNPSFNGKGQPNNLHLIKELLEKMDLDEKYALMPWLIIEVKQLINKLKTKTFEESSYNCRVHYLHLEILLLNRNACDEDEKGQVQKFILELLKILKNDMRNEKYRNQLQAFVHSSTYMDYLIDVMKELLQKYGNIKNIKQKSTLSEIYELSIGMITKFEKKNFLQFVIKMRYKCAQQYRLLKALIENEQFKGLKLSHYSMFVQFLFETLLVVQQGIMFSQEQSEQLVSSITEYIQFIFLTLDSKTKIPKSVFYSYPHLFGHKEGMKDTNKIIKRMNRTCQKVEFLQLRGGIYFKCILIITKLMKLHPNQDYTNLAEYFLFGPKKSGKSTQNDILNSLSLAKQRSLAEMFMSESNDDHRAYFIKEDMPYNAQNQELDLNSYISDYFLMNMAEYLQIKSQKMEPQLLQKYNNIFLLGCSNQRINRQLQIATNQNVQVHNYDDISRLIDQQYEKSSNQTSSPLIVFQRVPSTPEKSPKSNDIPLEVEFHSERDLQFLNVSPKRDTQRKKTADFTSESKKRMEVLEGIKQDYRNWYRNENSKKISTYFSERAKQIRIIELLHTHFVLRNSLFLSKVVTQSKIREKYEAFTRNYNNKLQSQLNSKLGPDHLQNNSRKVKKIHPYTSSKSPVLNIIQNCFGTMTCPITLKITKTEYGLRRLKSQQSMNMNFYLHSKDSQQTMLHQAQENEKAIESIGRISSVTEEVIEVEEQQHFITKQKPYCELITREGAYFCEYQLESAGLILTSKMQRHICENLWYLRLGSPDQNLIRSQIKVQIRPQDIHQIFFRRFNQITNNSLQFFMKNGTSKYISFYRKQALSILVRHLEKVFKGIKIIKDTAKQFEEAKFTQRWTEGHISNFDYLMLLNKYSGRSHNDLNQYYVFPWILKDYLSDKLDLTNPDIYRDLEKPIGALNPQKLRRYKEKYRNQPHSSERCLYGSHYSASLIIFYYMVRLEPFSSLHREMQKGQWDVADRLFSSIYHVWQSLMSESSATDIKECIPEFYYLPAFLRNIGNIDLGKKQNGEDVGDVELPPWASNAEQFIVTLRAALQSDYVSENLHSWIDLIFGKHQNSQQKNNVFHPYSYSDPQVLLKVTSKNHKNVDGIICHISYFGQCPIQLFKKQHKPKKPWTDVRPKSIKSIETGGNSQSTSSNKSWGQASLLPGWRVKSISSQNNDFVLELKHAYRQQKQSIILSAFSNISTLKESVQTMLPFRKIQPRQTNDIKVLVNKNKQVLIGNQFITDLDFKFNFQHTEVNQLWIACFGTKGLKIYNWQKEQTWSWESDEVIEVNLEPTRLIFSTPKGKLYFYSFLDHKLQQIIVFKDVYDMNIKVLPLPRLPSRQKNQINYKILCVGDGNRISIVSYTFQQIMNATSMRLCSLN